MAISRINITQPNITSGSISRSSIAGSGLESVLALNPAAMYDVSVLSSLYQDSAKTTPVTGAGDLVGAVEDLTGNNLDFAVLSPTQRPVFAIGTNGQQYMTFNGVGQFLYCSTSYNYMHNGTGGAIFGTFQAGTTSNPNQVYGLFGNNGGSQGNIGHFALYDDRSGSGYSDTLRFYVTKGVGAQAPIQIEGQNDTTPNTCQVWGVSYSGSDSPEGRAYIDGSQVETAAEGFSPVSSPATYFTQWGASGNSVAPLAGGSGVLIAFDRIPTENERTIINNYLEQRKWT